MHAKPRTIVLFRALPSKADASVTCMCLTKLCRDRSIGLTLPIRVQRDILIPEEVACLSYPCSN